ncbi:GNAT family N-acetyltransferase [Micromonospora echinofusca]|uniref:GNAT family N-acetyltransferase n=1 Tax=Micromonospora echinofusca TaxID=47858 RepID=A0ABS3VQ01_MICEH|nr:GNAT family N-acetyltransferase [Micromonospora echinofusca]MBO4206548.1 GNAT family N-acetyltransferase [Micromonospora echinofusca]
MAGDVRLVPVDDKTLEPLLSIAAAEAEPDDVMPPVEAPAGWSHARREAFRDFHRAHYGGLEGPTRTLMYAIMLGGEVVGMIRLARRDEPGVMETGMWLGRSARGQGIAVAALREALTEAAGHGARVVVAETTAGNTPAIGVLTRCGAVLRRDGDDVHAEIVID